MPEPKVPKTLVVFPNDPLERYEGKGEVKPRYFNPGNYFDRVHVIALADSDSGLEAAKVMAGQAEVKIHPVGRPGPFNFGKVLGRARKLVEETRPQAIRGYNPLLMGWMAVKLAAGAKATSVVSVHADYHLGRNMRIQGPRFLFSPRGVYQTAHSTFGMYRTSLGRADHVICAYNFPTGYVQRWRTENVSVIYNRVDLSLFRPGERQQAINPGPLKILSAGRQFSGKDPEPLIRAAARLDNVHLTLVGDGPLHDRLRKLAQQLGIDNRVKFLPSLEHSQLPELYRAHDLFAINITYPGVCIPVLEAAASGLPVVINRPLWEKEPEVVGTLAEVVENTPDGYSETFRQLLDDPEYRINRGKSLREHAAGFDGDLMEQREQEIYRRLCENQTTGNNKQD